MAVLAVAVTWPDLTEAGALHYEPWTVASRWSQTLVEKVAGFGGIVLQDSPALCLVGFGLPQTLEPLPQRAVQAALAIRQLAEAQTATGDMVDAVVRLAGHLGTLLVAGEAGASPGHWLAVEETVALPVRLLGHAAPGELLVSTPIARLTQDWVDMRICPLPSGNEPSAPLLAYRVGQLLPAHALPDRDRDNGSPPVPGAGARADRAARAAGVGRGRPGAGGGDCRRAWHGQVTASVAVAGTATCAP